MEAKILALSRSTDTKELCVAWGLSHSAVLARKKGERPLTIREVGALAALYDLTLPGVLSVEPPLGP